MNNLKSKLAALREKKANEYFTNDFTTMHKEMSIFILAWNEALDAAHDYLKEEGSNFFSTQIEELNKQLAWSDYNYKHAASNERILQKKVTTLEEDKLMLLKAIEKRDKELERAYERLGRS